MSDTENTTPEATPPEATRVVEEAADEMDKDKALAMSGVKEKALNEEGIEAVKADAVKKEVVPVADNSLPSFFIDPEKKERITVDIMYDKSNGRIMSVATKGIFEDEDMQAFDYLGQTVEWFEFTVPDYDDIASYRTRSSVFRREVNRMVVDPMQMRNFLIIWHLKDWSLRDSKGEKVTLEHDGDGSVSRESISTIYSISPTIMDVVLSSFEKTIILN